MVPRTAYSAYAEFMRYEKTIENLVGQSVFNYGELWPQIPASVFLAPGSRVIGEVSLGQRVNVWYNAVIRGDIHWVKIGDDTNVQDNCTLHVTHDTGPLTIGSQVVIGHAAVVHACLIHDRVLIGMNATILDGAIVESDTMIAAGAVLTPNTHIPSGVLAAGVPAKVIRKLSQAEIESIPDNTQRYVGYAKKMMESISSLNAR